MRIKLLSVLLLGILLTPAYAYSKASVNGPESVKAGADFKVEWTGPNNKYDFVSIAEIDSKDRKYKTYAYTKKGQSLSLRAPDTPGKYEIRYVEGKTNTVLARKDINVLKTTATIQIPTEISAGSEFKVFWTGPNNRQDFITIVKADTEERKYSSYKYTKNSKEDRDAKKYIKLRAPDDSGEYEVRYLTGQKYFTLARANINVTSTTATLSSENQAKAGSEIKVYWEGPNNRQDFITIVEADAEERKYSKYKYTKNSKTDRENKSYVTLRVPDKDGSYEIRYLTGQKYKTLARIPLTVLSTDASVEAPSEVSAGSKFKVYWTGPDNKQDFITIVKSDEEEKRYGKSYKYTNNSKEDRDGKKYLELNAPDDEGSYEVRYLTGQSYKTLAFTPVAVKSTTATLSAPKQVTANEKFDVKWTGPDNQHDYIAIFESKEVDAKYSSYSYTRRGNPLKIKAPEKPGIYELRYLTGQTKKILAGLDVEVIPSKVPGSLKVVADTSDYNSSSSNIGAVELILDASGSMLKKLNGTPRINVAKNALVNLVNNSLSENTPFALRVFGHKEADSCRTDLEIALNPLKKNSTVSKIKSIQAKNLAKTPIGKSLSLISSDLAGIEGKTIIILVTDGEETCDGDPKAEIQKLIDSGYDIRVNIVGFAIDELMLKETFREWARVGNGSYFDATNAKELSESLEKAVEVPFEVINSKGDVVANGVVNGKAIEIPSGIYSLKILGTSTKTIENIKIKPKFDNIVKVQ